MVADDDIDGALHKPVTKFSKQGFLLKKSSKQFMGIGKWTKRYSVLDNDRLLFYSDESKKEQKKVIMMKKVQTVVFHYDENAPTKSKKLRKSERDESRFDIYTKGRTYMMKSVGNSIWDSEAWVRILRQSAEFHNPNFNMI